MSVTQLYLVALRVPVRALRRIRINMTNKRDSVSSGYPDTEKRVENTRGSEVFFDKIRGV